MGEKFVGDMAQVIRRGDHEPNIMGCLEENKSVKMLRTTKYRQFMVSLYKTNSFVYHGLVYGGEFTVMEFLLHLTKR